MRPPRGTLKPPVPDLPGETWRDWGEHWAVSNLGRFKALERYIENSRGVWRFSERLLTPRKNVGLRRCFDVRYQKDGESTSISLYRVMWLAFRGDLPDDKQLTCVGPLCVDNLTLKGGQPRAQVQAVPG